MINQLTNEIQKCIENECYIVALGMALTLPDICGKAEYPGLRPGERYKKWFDENIGKYERSYSPYETDMPYTNGELIYSLRNSMLHQGTPNVEKENIKDVTCKIDEFLLIIDDVYNGGFSSVEYGANNEIVNREIQVNIVNLCMKICNVAKNYYSENRDKFSFINYRLQDRRNDDFKKLFAN